MDISEKEQPEMTFKESEERFQQLFNQAPLGYQSLDIDGNFLEVNQKWLEMLGYKREEVIGKWFGDFLTPMYQDGFRKRFPIFKAQGHIHSEFEMLHKNGSILFIAFEGRIGNDLNGNFKQTHCILQDITERKKAENALKESEEKYRRITDNIIDVVWTSDLQFNLNYVSPSVRKMLGLTEQEHLNRSLAEKFPPESLAKIQQIFKEEFEKEGNPAFDKNHSRCIEVQYYKKDGSLIWAEINVSIIRNEFGVGVGLQGMTRDITDRKQAKEALSESEEVFRSAFENSSVGKSITSIDGQLKVNTSFCKILGYKEAEFKNLKWQKITHEDDVEPNVKIVEDLLKGESISHRWEKRYIHKNGNIIWVDITTTLHRNAVGKPLFFITEIIDITDRKNADIALLEAKKAVEKSEIFLNNIINNIGDPVFVKDEESRLVLVNDAFCSIFGLSRDLSMGKTLVENVLEDERESFLRIDKQVIEDGQENISIETLTVDEKETRTISTRKSRFIDKSGKKYLIGVIRDITELKRDEMILRESEEKFSKAFKSSPDLIMLTEFESGRIVDVNERLFDLTGYNYEEFIGKTTNEIHYWTNPEDRERFINLLARDGFVHNLEVKLSIKSGELRDNLVSAEIIELQNGKFILGVNRDVTELKKSEEALIKSQKLLQEITDNSTSLIYALDTRGCFTLINKSLEKVFGQNREVLIGKKREDFMPIEIAEIHYANDLNVIETLKPITIEEESIESDGKHTYLSVKFPLVDLDGNLVGVSGISTDITERKKIDNEIRENRAKLDAALASMNDSILITDAEGKYIEYNEAYLKFIRLNNEDHLPMDFNQFGDIVDMCYLNGELIPKEKWVIPSALRGETAINIEYRLQRKDTGESWIGSYSFSPIHDDKGAIVGSVVVARDVTEMKLAEKILSESERRFRELLSSVKMISVILDMEGNITFCNDFLLNLTNWKRKEVIGKNWFENFLPENANENVFEVFKKARNEGIVITNYENEILSKDGRQLLIEWNNTTLYDENGKINGVASLGVDITERKKAEKALKESEQKLSALFASMTEMVALHELVFDPEGKPINYRIIDCNNAFTISTGIQKEDAIGKLATEVYAADVPPYFEEYTRVAISGESLEYKTYYAPMDKHFLISVVSPSKNKFATITSDISEIEQIQAEIKAKNKELENYIYAASHDLRSPLVNIQGFSQRLQKQTIEIKDALAQIELEEKLKTNLAKLTNEAIPNTLNFILSNVTKMDGLINALLQISRTGRIAMDISKIDMNRLFKKIVEHTGFEIAEISAKVTIGDLPECFGDENQLNQLFSNIIGNALKYRNLKRKLEINISAQANYNKVIYCISDNGIGIAPQNLEKIWNVFYRVDTFSQESGDGIGLSLVSTIANKHKGKVWAESVEGVGSWFYVELQSNKFEE